MYVYSKAVFFFPAFSVVLQLLLVHYCHLLVTVIVSNHWQDCVLLRVITCMLIHEQQDRHPTNGQSLQRLPLSSSIVFE